MDNVEDTGHEGEKPVAVVGIGASAGGLAALQKFFSEVPGGSGLAFVVVVHLSPEHESHLADLLQPLVAMPVQQVTETVALEANHVYVIPPNAHLSAIDTHLRLSALERERGVRTPIDHFLRTLSATHGQDAIAVILTGTGSDGALGLKAIKECGGFSIVQDPLEAEFDGMPQSAIATGLVDRVLRLNGIVPAILSFIATAPRVPIPVDDDPGEVEPRQLQQIFMLVRTGTGRDFSGYNLSTVLRRITRRMQLAQLEQLSDYVDLLRRDSGEVTTLAHDLLITVTEFFRDSDVFAELARTVIPKLFEAKGPEDEIRVWSVGCATGEEAYSLAMLLIEGAENYESSSGIRPTLRVFASDLHAPALRQAREGFYPGEIEGQVTAERLLRYFHREDGGYRVRRELRDMVVFADHSVIGDPPFSNLDLIACRNMLIYLRRNVQRDVIELFHYSLRAGGHLVLGTSESIGTSELFQAEDKTRGIWKKRSLPLHEPRVPVFPLMRTRAKGEETPAVEDDEPGTHGALHQRLLEPLAPPSMLVSPEDMVVHLSEHAGRYLAPRGGAATLNVFQLVRNELQLDLRIALHQARASGEPVRTAPLEMQYDGDSHQVVVHVRPAVEPEHEGYCVVVFEESSESRGGEIRPVSAGEEAETLTAVSESELEVTRERLQTLLDQYQATQDELRASNEELQSANEELRSTLEELQTSKEELQAVNEELQTVNQENRHKVEELGLLTSDLQNLLASTEIATLFLDRQLRILRFTPTLSTLFNVRPVDRGRPLSDLTSRLRYKQLPGDAEGVLQRLIPVEREVEDSGGKWYLVRVLPYRSLDDRIEGVVITFVDITTRKMMEEELRRANLLKDELLGMVSHEFRTPLTIISGNIDVVAERFEELDTEERAEVFDDLRTQRDRLRRLIENMLLIAKADSGLPAETEPFLAQRLLPLLVAQEGRHGARVRLAVDDHLPPVIGNAGYVEQILENLLTNARKYGREGAEIALTVVRHGDGAVISVDNEGDELDQAEVDRFFQPFYQSPARSRNVGGAGLGLAVCQRLAKAMSSSMSARAKPEGGLLVSFTLPLVSESQF